MEVGQKVRITTTEWLAQCQWWPKEGATGTVQKVFKNGKVAVAVDQVKNRSEDGCWTGHFKAAQLFPC